MVRRFLDGLRDNEAQFEIEFHKEPEDIDDAVYHAVNFIQTKRSFHEHYAERKFKKYARRTKVEEDIESEEEESMETDTDFDRVYRVPIGKEKAIPKSTDEAAVNAGDR